MIARPCDKSKRQDGPKHAPAAMRRNLTIYLGDDSDDDEMIVARVSELVSEGYTSGYGPYWTIEERADPAAEIAALRNMLQRLVDECSQTRIAPEGVITSRPCLLTLEQARAVLNQP